jgi:hypothetical protein
MHCRGTLEVYEKDWKKVVFAHGNSLQTSIGGNVLTYEEFLASLAEHPDEFAPVMAAVRAGLAAINPFCGERVHHKKRGSTYTVIGAALVQTSDPIADNAELILYRSDSGMIFARPPSEFNDGRFEFLHPAPEGDKWGIIYLTPETG